MKTIWRSALTQGALSIPRACLRLPQRLEAGADSGDFHEFGEAMAQAQSVDEPDEREKGDRPQQVEGNDGARGIGGER